MAESTHVSSRVRRRSSKGWGRWLTGIRRWHGTGVYFLTALRRKTRVKSADSSMATQTAQSYLSPSQAPLIIQKIGFPPLCLFYLQHSCDRIWGTWQNVDPVVCNKKSVLVVCSFFLFGFLTTVCQSAALRPPLLSYRHSNNSAFIRNSWHTVRCLSSNDPDLNPTLSQSLWEEQTEMENLTQTETVLLNNR